MSELPAQKIVPHLRYTREAEEASRFYASVYAEKTKAKRVAEEMLKPVKFDIAKLEAAFHGR